mgnify:CR=1 FL=1
MGMELIIQIIAGLLGGNAAGAGLKNLSLGTAGNSVAGAVGGGLGGLLMGMLGGDAGAAAGAATAAACQATPGGRLAAVAGKGDVHRATQAASTAAPLRQRCAGRRWPWR